MIPTIATRDVFDVDDAAIVDGVVIQLKASGLCLSDWHGWMGHDLDIVLPHIPGHELAGTIESIGKNVKKHPEIYQKIIEHFLLQTKANKLTDL